MNVDLYCRVIDNYGDAGICWRLARQMRDELGWQVRLFIDQPMILGRLDALVGSGTHAADPGAINIHDWPQTDDTIDVPGDVVIEAFGCRLPDAVERAMAAKRPAPLWINLEYLSAEPWIDDCHGLPSPHPRLPLTKFFFFPGFSERSGGVLCERHLASTRDEFWRLGQASRFLAQLGVQVPEPAGNTFVSLFCYADSPIADLAHAWRRGPSTVICLVPAGAPTDVLRALGVEDRAGSSHRDGALTSRVIPFLSQDDYDRLLWSCDVNFVRGEDSFLRAQWALRPFVWQPYRQSEQTHLIKLEAFLARYLADAPAVAASALRGISRAWSAPAEIDWLASWKTCLHDVAGAPKATEHRARWAAHLVREGRLLERLASFIKLKLK